MIQQLKITSWLLFLLVNFFITHSYDAYSSDTNQSSAKQKHKEARDLYQQQSGYKARFGEGIACYRLKDFSCAINAFSLAAWQGVTPRQRAYAIFNLANSHFFSGNFKQSIVLFRESALLGIDNNKVSVNLEFAQSLAKSVQKYQQNIKKAEEKAKWLAQAGNLSNDFVEHFAEGIYLSALSKDGITLQNISAQEIKQLLLSKIQRLSDNNIEATTDQRVQWFKTTQNTSYGNTAELMNRLMPMEIGIPITENAEPYRLKEHRSW